MKHIIAEQLPCADRSPQCSSEDRRNYPSLACWNSSENRIYKIQIQKSMLVVKSSIGKIKQIKNVESEKDQGRDLAQWERPQRWGSYWGRYCKSVLGLKKINQKSQERDLVSDCWNKRTSMPVGEISSQITRSLISQVDRDYGQTTLKLNEETSARTTLKRATCFTLRTD